MAERRSGRELSFSSEDEAACEGPATVRLPEGDGEECLVTQKGREIFVHGGHIYRFDRMCKPEGSSWRCLHERQYQCKGRIRRLPSGVVEEVSDHSHAPDPTEVEKKKFVKQLKETARESYLSPSRVVAQQIQKIAPGTSAIYSSIDHYKRIVRKSREDLIHGNPRRLEDLVVPAELRVDHEKQPFLQFDNGPEAADNRLIIFASGRALEILGESEVWMLDGTFRAAPTLFYQLFTVNAYHGNCFVSVAYCLLVNKTQETYKALLQIVKQLVPDAIVKTAVMDFERGLLNAFGEVFPSVEIHGCYFHYCQAIWRRIQGLPQVLRKYASDHTFALHMRMLMALAYVPTDNVRRYYAILKASDVFTENFEILEELLDYMSRTWIGTKVSRRYRKPLFDLQIWNCYDHVVRCFPLTNNMVEGWHRGFSSLIQDHHPAFHKLVRAFQENNALTLHNYTIRLAANAPQTRKRRYKDRTEEVRRIVETFGRPQPLQYLASLAAKTGV